MATTSSPPIPLEAKDTFDDLKDNLREIWLEVDQIESKSVQSHSELVRVKTLKDIAFDAEDAIADCEWLVRTSSSSGDSQWPAIQKKMKEILKKYQDSKHRSKSLEIHEWEGKLRNNSCCKQPTGSIPDKQRIVVGMDEYIKLIIESITRDFKQIVIFPVVGPPGIGIDLTTIAQHVFRNFEVDNHFQLRGWVSMSDVFDELKLAKAVYESLALSSSISKELIGIQEELRQLLDGKRFLIVLVDIPVDVWTKNGKWESLWNTLASVEKGGVVVITTQDYKVIEKMKKNQLSIEFAYPLVLDRLKEELPMIDQTIKCKGLPFSVKDHVHPKKRKWIEALSNGEILNDILRDLKSSYYGLKAPLKRCIAYCSLFPDYHEFDKQQLIRLWIAEGFIHPKAGTDTLEDIGSKYFEKLLYRFYFQFFKDDRHVIPFRLYDTLKSTNSTSRGSEHHRIMGDNATHAFSHVRHASYVVQNHNNEIKGELLDQAKRLRTFIIISNECKSQIDLSLLSRMNYLRTLYLCYIDIRQLPDSLGDLKHLRFLGLFGTRVRLLPDSTRQLYNLQTLDLSYSDLEELPEYIGNLEQLRFLGLNGTAIRTLPDSINMFKHLQTLELMNCLKFEELPRDMRGMTSLRHLRVDSNCNFCMPAKLGELVELQTLQRFNVSQADGYAGIKELRGLGKIRRELNISGLCNVNNVDDCKVANLESKQFIQKLTLDWSSHVGKQHKEETDDDDYDEKLSDDDSEEMNLQDRELPYSEVDIVPHTTAVGEITSDERQLLVDDQSNTIDLEPELMEIARGVDTLNSSFCATPEQTPEHVAQVLENLKPNNNLKILIVQSYHGTVFPQWLGDKSFTNLWSVTLKYCKNCDQLPSLGLLPSLKYLTIDHMFIRSIQHEFCLDVEDPQHEKCFPKLLELCFKQLYELEKWTGVRDVDFPELETCTIFNCPKLGGIPCFVSLKTLEIENCWSLKALPEFPKLQTLRLIACDELVKLPSLKELHNLTVMYCKSLVSVSELPLLKNLWIEDCDQLKSLDLLVNCSTTTDLHKKLEPFGSFIVINCHALAFRFDKKLPIAFDKEKLLTWFQNNA